MAWSACFPAVRAFGAIAWMPLTPDDPEAGTGDVVLSKKPSDWQGLLDTVALNAHDDLLIERRQTLDQPRPQRQDPFELWQE